MPDATKAIDSQAERALQRSVVEPQTVRPGSLPAEATSSLLWAITAAASDIQPWGTNATRRDRQLREFLPTEPIINSAIAGVIARNAGFTWRLDGPPLTTKRAQGILHAANYGEGWLNFMMKLCYDVLCQDKGGFIEIIRDDPNGPTSPCIGIGTLDAARCFHTGDPENPVLYRDRKDKWHLLPWYNVVTVSEMPTPHETLYGLQMSALSRVLQAAQVFRNIQIYMDEKTGGRHTRAIHIVSGVAKAEMEAAIKMTQQLAEQRGQLRYIQPVITTTLQPTGVNVATLELSSLPDGFDAEQAFKQYLTVVSMGLLTDFQEFAPLPGGALGSGAQSQVLHLKSRGKGPMLFRKLMEHVLNFSGILPQNVTFTYDEQDVDVESELADLREKRANGWKVLFEIGAIDAAGVRQLALDAGDIPQELFDRMGAGAPDDLTQPGNERVEDTNVAAEEDPLAPAALKSATPRRRVAGSPKVEQERLDFEKEIADAIEGGFGQARERVVELLQR